jgi:hypothetical protein
MEGWCGAPSVAAVTCRIDSETTWRRTVWLCSASVIPSGWRVKDSVWASKRQAEGSRRPEIATQRKNKSKEVRIKLQE